MFKKLKALIASLFAPKKLEGGLRSCRKYDTEAAKQIQESIDRFRKEIREGQRTETGRTRQPYRPAVQNIPRQPVKPKAGNHPGWRSNNASGYSSSFSGGQTSVNNQTDPLNAAMIGYWAGSNSSPASSISEPVSSGRHCSSSSYDSDYSSSHSSSSSSSSYDSSSYDSGSSYSSSSCD